VKKLVSVTATDFINVMNITDSATNMEYVLDLAIDTLNLYGATTIANMSGTAGSKTVSLTSKQKGGVFLVARDIYYGVFKGIENITVAGLAVTISDVLGNPTIARTIETVARRLTTVDFHVGEDTTGYE